MARDLSKLTDVELRAALVGESREYVRTDIRLELSKRADRRPAVKPARKPAGTITEIIVNLFP